ncbi:HD domain-containing protein [Vibrio sinaloensis]|nr:HD domain-containing protein [Vibrio sinaloensis]
MANHLSQFDHHKALLTPEYIELLYKSAPLHDVGKVGIPDNILLKPGKLTDEEFGIMKGHPEIGAKALSMAEKNNSAVTVFLQLAKRDCPHPPRKVERNGLPKSAGW